ncbi:MAG: MBL fold metallo-hydrolase [Myxococcota bacterium]|nr:MBL fold metallo-hydrolase [Myxococcota bacterium]
MDVEGFFDPQTSTLTYLVYDADARVGVVIDPVLDFDMASGRTGTRSADAVATFAEGRGLRIPYVLDTHAHADHLSAIPYFKERFGARSGIGAGITEVQRVFGDTFNLGPEFVPDGRQFDVLLEEGSVLDVEAFELRALHTPGHTPACLTYRVEDALFVGDTLFQPDHGTARCDFPGGSAAALYDSIQRLYDTLPGSTRVFTCHDYQPGGRELAFESSLAEQRDGNVQLRASTTREEFVAFRTERDATLGVPALILPSMQVNIRAGELPAPESNGVAYLKLPLDRFGGA